MNHRSRLRRHQLMLTFLCQRSRKMLLWLLNRSKSLQSRRSQRSFSRRRRSLQLTRSRLLLSMRVRLSPSRRKSQLRLLLFLLRRSQKFSKSLTTREERWFSRERTSQREVPTPSRPQIWTMMYQCWMRALKKRWTKRLRSTKRKSNILRRWFKQRANLLATIPSRPSCKDL